MDECVFCKIAAGILPSYKIYEDSNFLAFLDINPVTDGHTLLVPKQHFDYVWDVTNIGELFTVAQKIALHFRKVTADGLVYSFVHGEGVKHAHLHIMPKPVAETNAKIIDAFTGKKLTDEIAKDIILRFSL